ncbi:hypothetical protein SAMN05660199_03963 [Klenkia soli]|uniref:Uncharacterized protein n=1 Tax=Klenkia soli TaxID=1052260 RepID=A0A1H0SXS9_9ACTN|nr:hypothetical protein SAMN05660199_03963 [Klenkia soli]
MKDRYQRKGGRVSYPLSALPGSPTRDSLMAVSVFFESLAGVLDAHKDSYFGEVTSVHRRGRTIAATMNAGRGGLESMLSDPSRNDEAPFMRERRHVERVPIRQLVVIPENSVTGYWIIEAVGLRTLSHAYRQAFRREFGGRWKRLTWKFEPIVHEEAWEQYEASDDAMLEEVRVVRRRATRDRATALGVGDVEGEYIEIMQQASPKRGGKLLRKIRRKHYRRNDEGNLVPRDADVTEVSVRVRIGDHETSVIIDRERAVGMRVPLTTERDERPTDSYFYSRAREWVVELAGRDDVLLPADWAQTEWQHDPTFGQLGAEHGADTESDEQDRHDGTGEGSDGDPVD